MKTLILPGFSESNKDWTSYLKENLKVDHSVEILDWEHWKLGGGIKLKKELEKIDKIVKSETFNIIAKSVGTMVCMKVLDKYKNQIYKIILCGVPSISSKRIDLFEKSIENFDPKKITCFQNTFDPFVRYEDLKTAVGKINKEIPVIRKDAKNHDYYYSDDFNKFLEA